MKNWVKFRIARPTDKFEEVTSFYEKGLGLKRIGEFYDHEGYDGVMFGLPDEEYHLEFTRHEDGSPCPAPTKDKNPYWKEKGITIEDPDGWRIVLMKIEEQGFKL